MENQIEVLKKYAEENKWKLVEIIKDVASWLKEDRRRLWKLIEMAKKHEFDVLLIAYGDRLKSSASNILRSYSRLME